MDNAIDYLNVATAVVTIASVIARLTPTPKDDKIVKKLYNFIQFIALNKPQGK